MTNLENNSILDTKRNQSSQSENGIFDYLFNDLLKEKYLNSDGEADFILSSLKNLPDLLFIIDFDGCIRNYHYSSPKELLPKPTEFLGKRFNEIFPHEVASKFYGAVFKVTKKHAPVSIEYSLPVNNINKIFEARFIPGTKNILIIIREITKSKRAEEALKLSELRFRSIWENSNDGMRLIDKNGNIIAVNNAYCKLTGMDLQDMVGKHASVVYQKTDYENFEEYNNIFKNREPNREIQNNYETHVIFRSGKQVYIEVSNTIIDSVERDIFEGQIFMLSIFRDISDRKTSEKILRENEERYRTLVETSPDCIIQLDLEGNVVTANIQTFLIFGFSDKENFLGKNIFRFVAHEDRPRVMADMKKIIELKNLRDLQYTLLKRNGTKLPVEINASYIQGPTQKQSTIISIIRDISARKQAEDKLKNSELQFRSVWENSNDGMRLTNSMGIITAVNKSFCHMVGSSEENLIGSYFYECYADKTMEQQFNSLELYLENFAERKFKPYRQSRSVFQSGRSLDLDVTYKIIDFEKGEPLLLGIFHDISERKRAEEELRKSEKLAAIGKMAAYLSHEIKTPLASIKMNIDMIPHGMELSPHKQRSFTIIQREVRRLNKLLKNVLQFSRSTELIQLNFNFNNLFNSIKEFLAPMLDEKEIIFINKVDNISINGDYQKLHSVLLHLIENSIDAINTKGTIEVYSEIDPISNTVSIFVKDSGCGIDNSEQIFDPFYTTKPSGTGLGLPIAQKLIEQHSGELRLVSSRPGETIFQIIFYN